jgi:hypothetical protein
VADLRGANLREADLRGAHLSVRRLHGARLPETDLRGAIGLMPDQWAAAASLEEARLPSELEAQMTQPAEEPAPEVAEGADS